MKQGSEVTVSKVLLPSAQDIRSFSVALAKLMTSEERHFLRKTCLSYPTLVPRDLWLDGDEPFKKGQNGSIRKYSWLIYYFRHKLRSPEELAALYWARIVLLKKMVSPGTVRRIFGYLKRRVGTRNSLRHRTRAFLYSLIPDGCL